MSKYCRGCQKWCSKQGTNEFEHWKIEHDCPTNHVKSSGAMEAAGAVPIFSSSVDKNKLIDDRYVGDGGTASFKEVVNYENFQITPTILECVGHVQKRLGTHLRTKEVPQKFITPLAGRGKLTDKV